MWITVFKNCAFNINGRKSDLSHITFVVVHAVLFMKCRALGSAPELLSFPSLHQACLPSYCHCCDSHTSHGESPREASTQGSPPAVYLQAVYLCTLLPHCLKTFLLIVRKS